MSGETLVRGTCHHDCPDSCGWEVTVADGVAVSLRGAPDHPYSSGELCPKVNRFLGRVYHPDRLTTPLRRTGPKGSGSFEPCTWNEALALVAGGLREAIERHGAESVMPYSLAGTQGLVQMDSISARFFHHLGATLVDRNICGSTAGWGAALGMGAPLGLEPTALQHARHIIVWGTNTKLTNRHLWPSISAARAAGAKLVVIDPLRTITAADADQHLAIRPGTDSALALGMMSIIIDHGLVDHDYVERHTSGFEDLAVRCAEYPADRVASICAVEAADIERLAIDFATIRPTAIRTLIGPEHRAGGAAMYHAIGCLATLVGAWRDHGGGMARSTGRYSTTALDTDAVTRPDLLAGRTPRRVNMSSLGSVLNDPELDPPVAALVVYNCNPVLIAPDQNRVIEGLTRDDLYCVVLEHFMTDTARYADVVLPATTQLEHLDLVPPWGHLYLGLNRPAIAPVGESLPNTEIFRRLSAAMGLDEPCLYDTDSDVIDTALASGHGWLDGVTRERLESETWVRLDVPEGGMNYADGGFGTESGRFELRSTLAEALGMDPLPVHVERPAPAGCPIMLLSVKVHTKFLNGSYSHLDAHRPAEGEPRVTLSRGDADARSITTGDAVRVHNERGALTLTAAVSDDLAAGVATIPFGWWPSGSPGGRSANALTNPTIVDAGGAPAFFDTWVEVDRCSV